MGTYSRRWFETFLGRIDAAIVEHEIAFLKRQLPAEGRVLDLCCGPGRHAVPLVEAGYHVVGVDLDATALREAAGHAPTAQFVRGDMRRIPLVTGAVSAVICMWQSFGHFDDKQNTAVLCEMTRVLRPGGVLVLDIYHRGFHQGRLGHRDMEREGVRVHETRTMSGTRLRAQLDYDTGDWDVFEWGLYVPSEIVAIGAACGLRSHLACAQFDESVAASENDGRMQIIFTKS
ncbi:MAG: class I SAM-dependent methyltransferase [Gemmatimonadaceae bacterium]